MKNRDHTMVGRPLAASSMPGEHGKPLFAKTASEWATSLAALVALAILGSASTQAAARYQLINLGSLGGTNYYESFSGLNGKYLNNSGTVVGGMDTSVPDPFCFNNPSCLTSHAFEWTSDSLADLGTLAFNEKGNFSQAFWIND